MLSQLTPEQIEEKRERIKRQKQDALIREMQIVLPEEKEKQREYSRKREAERTAALQIVKQLQQGIMP